MRRGNWTLHWSTLSLTVLSAGKQTLFEVGEAGEGLQSQKVCEGGDTAYGVCVLGSHSREVTLQQAELCERRA